MDWVEGQQFLDLNDGEFMRMILMILMTFSVPVFSMTEVDCAGDKHRFQIVAFSASDINISYNGETVKADGNIDTAEVDLVARFKSIGEMTLFAKRGMTDAANYLFTGGRRISIYCN